MRASDIGRVCLCISEREKERVREEEGRNVCLMGGTERMCVIERKRMKMRV